MSENKIIKTTVVADTSSYRKGMQDAAKETEDFGRKAQGAAAPARDLGAALASTASESQVVTESLGSAAGQLNRVKASAAQTEQALRQLPMQFTDIFTSLSSGMPPMQVLMQQGGQLKDSFGGVGPAAQAMGGYIGGLVGPLSATVGALGALALAYYQGSEEGDRFSTGLILTGNVAGKTVGELSDLAKTVSIATRSTQAFSADALSQVVSTGAIAADSIGTVAEASVRMARATGMSVGETIKQFVELGKDPVKASEKLNETANYLTADLYRQIKALEAHGKASEAASLAQKVWADTLNQRTGEITKNLGYIETAWGGVIDAAKAGWDAILGVGRTQSKGERIAELEQKAAPGRGVFAGLSADERVELAGLKAVLANEQQTAKAAADRAASTAATIKWDREGEQYLPKKLRMEQEIAKARNLAKEASVSDVELQKRISAIEERYADKEKKTRAAPKVRTDDDRVLGDWQRRVSLLDAEAAGTEKLTATEQAYVSVLSDVTSGRVKMTTAARGRFAALASEALALEKTQLQEKEAAKAAEEHAKWINAMWQAEVKETARLEEALQKEEERVAALGMSKEAVNQLAAAQLEAAAAAKEVYAENLKAASAFAGEFADAYTQAAEEAKKQAEILRQTATQKVLAADREARIETAKGWQQMADNLTRSVTDAIVQGGSSGAETLRRALKAMVFQVVVQPAVQGMVGSAFGGSGGAYGASGASGSSGLLGSASNINTLSSLANYGAIGYQWATGSMSGANAVGTVTANATGSGLDGLIAATDGWGTVAADAGSTSAAGMSGWGLAGGALGGAMLGYQLTDGNALGTFAGGAGGIAAYGAASSAMAGGSMAAGASAALAAIPVWGWIALAALAIGGSMVTGGTPHLGGAYVAGTDGTGFKATDTNYENFGLDWGAYKSDRNAGIDGATKALAEGVAGSLGSILGKFGLDNYYQVGVRFASDGEDDSPGAIRVTNQAGEIVAEVMGEFHSNASRGLEDLAAKAGEVIQKTLLAADLPAWAEDTLAALGGSPSIDELNKALAAIGQFEAAAGKITDVLGISTDAVYGLTKAFGGMSAAGAALGNYYQLYYSDVERVADAQASLGDEFKALDLVLPESKAGFRQLVESIDTTTVAGQQLYAQLLNLASPFSEVVGAIENEAAGLQLQVWQLTGDTKAMRAAELEKINPANRALQERVWQLQDEQAAQQAAAQAATQAAASVGSVEDAFSSLASALRGAVDAMTDETEAYQEIARKRAQAQIETALAVAKASGGAVLPKLEDISGALQVLQQSSVGQFGSREDYLRDRYRTANVVASLGAYVPGFASGGDHLGGLRIVGEYGPELESTGPSRIVSNSQARSLLSMDEVVAELQALRADMRAAQVEVARASAKTAQVLQKWDTVGMPEVGV